MKNIALTVRHSLSGELKGEFLRIISFLQKEGKNVFITASSKKILRNEKKFSLLPEVTKKNIEQIDCFIFFGGDGTLLRTLHNFAPEIFTIPIFGINAGNVGFFSSVSVEKKTEAFKKLFAGDVTNDERMILEGSVYNEKGECIQKIYALNEITIHHSGIARLRKIDVSISDEFLTQYKADGLIISTPTGSTAYNLAAGGPIISPQIPSFTITPLAPTGFSQRSIVLPSHKNLQFSPDAEMNVSIDGQDYFSLKKNEKIIITQHKNSLIFKRLLTENYYKNLREKLGWGSC